MCILNLQLNDRGRSRCATSSITLWFESHVNLVVRALKLQAPFKGVGDHPGYVSVSTLVLEPGEVGRKRRITEVRWKDIKMLTGNQCVPVFEDDGCKCRFTTASSTIHPNMTKLHFYQLHQTANVTESGRLVVHVTRHDRVHRI